MLLCAAAATVAYIMSRRDSRLRKLVKELKAQEVTIEHAKSLRFNDLVLFLRKPATVRATTMCLEAIL